MELHPVIITAALVGGELSRKDTPYLPLRPQEMGKEAVEVVKEGASMVHLHARDEKGNPSHEIGIFAEIVQEIREQCKKAGVEIPLLQFSTGGSIGMSLAERMAPLSLRPDMASLTTGTVNFGPDIFENPKPVIEAIAGKLKEEEIGVELEIFDAGMIDNAMALLKEGLVQEPLHFNFVLGVPGSLSGDPENLVFLKNRLPPGSTWSVAGIGRWQLPLATLALTLGGHVRVGLEDNIFYRKGELAKGNAPLVARVSRLARELGREIATPEGAKKILQRGGPKMKKAKSNQRSHPRVPMMVKVMDRETGEEREYFSREVSCGGMFLETKERYSLGKLVQLRFVIPGAERQVQVSAEVMHVATAKEKGKIPGIGLQFLDIDPQSEKAIAQYVEKLENIRKKLTG